MTSNGTAGGKTVCVFCGSSRAVGDGYLRAARALGEGLAARGHALVYGGGAHGLMGETARAVMRGGGRVTGVFPDGLFSSEVILESVDELVRVASMHERKAVMAERADVFAALPGGFGTLEEVTEVLAHRQLGLHAKPCILINLGGYFDPLLAQFERSFAESFTGEEFRAVFQATETVEEALDLL